MRQDEVRDIIYQMLNKVCDDVAAEPMLIPLSKEHHNLCTANTENSARVDVTARDF